MSSPDEGPGDAGVPRTPAAPAIQPPPLPAAARDDDDDEFAARDEARARLAAIIESSDDAIVSKTLDGIIRTWNEGARRIFGYTAEEVVGKPITIIVPAD